MPAPQLHLFATPKPLMQQLGEAFFQAVPREPGVYARTQALPARDDSSSFQRALGAGGLGFLGQFYESGPRRNLELSRRHHVAGPPIL
jgi:hypothetical protein